jgi:hypothetical protein
VCVLSALVVMGPMSVLLLLVGCTAVDVLPLLASMASKNCLAAVAACFCSFCCCVLESVQVAVVVSGAFCAPLDLLCAVVHGMCVCSVGSCTNLYPNRVDAGLTVLICWL